MSGRWTGVSRRERAPIPPLSERIFADRLVAEGIVLDIATHPPELCSHSQILRRLGHSMDAGGGNTQRVSQLTEQGVLIKLDTMPPTYDIHPDFLPILNDRLEGMIGRLTEALAALRPGPERNS